MNFQSYLPSKTFTKNIGIIVLGTLLVVGLYSGAKALSGYFAQKKQEKKGDVIVNPVVKDILAIDHDQDGLHDWEEVLWGMDPNKADTNGNGVLDGAEVAPRRNTLITAVDENGAPIELSQTEQFLRELLMTSVALSQAGDVSEEGAQNLLQPAMETISKIQIGKVYTKADLNLVPNLDVEDVYAYTKAVNKVFSGTLINRENAIAIALGALREKDAKPLQELSKFLKEYDDVINTLLKVRVPTPLADVHLRLVNDYAFFRGNVAALQNVLENPIPAYASILQYQTRLNLYIQHVDDYQEVINYVLKKYSLIYS